MYVYAALATLLTVFCVANLLLMLAVVRRLRSHESRLAANSRPLTLPTGTRIAPFTTTTVDGDRISAAGLADGTLIGVFSPACEPCHAQLPAFVEHSRSSPALAVVLSDGDEATDMVAALAEACPLVVEGHGGAVSTALGVQGTPALVIVAQGAIVATESAVSRLPQPART
ncbi:TlpA family protein disulfide reductase [Phytomonospora endophytica]|uniref:Thioredoxin domain-containing protein n=1 Tax=Phytomonospora endophytica TaxID=714109 RepID=A0A841FVN1_9ACTN|nr:hypothetical protein [Phytomonospora endophytica]MBB6038823.1 hypothetical protein [Phytomonospora endophytica]GIG68381.1 hypothetical protein Pen01_46760 [Phytomonospora endophytica]